MKLFTLIDPTPFGIVIKGRHTLHVTSNGVFLHKERADLSIEQWGVFWRSKAYGKFAFHWPADHHIYISGRGARATRNGCVVMEKSYPEVSALTIEEECAA